MISLTECSQRLWAATRYLRPGSDGEALYEARLELAKAIYKTGGEGFPAPLKPTGIQLDNDAWRACVDAALRAAPDPTTGSLQDPRGTHYLLWPADTAQGSAKPQAPPSANSPWGWALRTTSVIAPNPFGPLRDTSRQGAPDLTLFCYTAVNAKDALIRGEVVDPGLYPRERTTSAPGYAPSLPDRRRRTRGGVWAWALGALSVGLAVSVLLMVYIAADLSGNALNAFRPAHPDCFATVDESALEKCATDWSAAWQKQEPRGSAESRLLAWKNVERFFWPAIDGEHHPSLLWPLTLAGLAIVLGVMAASLSEGRYLTAALIDERYRVSLSRLQQIGWTVLIFGGYFVLVVFNTAFGELSDKAFPTMNAYLWAALGITAFGSPIFSALILRRKDDLTTTPAPLFADVEIRRNVPPDPLEKRSDPGQARLSDLYMGESEANKHVIDISRLQSLIITFMLMSAYLIQLVELVRTISGETIIRATASNNPVFPSMPELSGGFVGLLAASHVGYLAFKAIPKAEPGADPGR